MENKELLANIDEQEKTISYLQDQVIELSDISIKQQKEIEKLSFDLVEQTNNAQRFQKEAQLHKNSIRYRMGTALFEARYSVKKFIRLPRTIFGLIRSDKDAVRVEEVSLKHVLKSNYSPLNIYKFSQFRDEYIALKDSKISIIIPIYNAYEDVKICIESVIKHTTFPYDLVLINDCSSDSRIKELLDKYEDFEQINVIENETNLGYVRSINKGIEKTNTDVVLLNSDTIVTPRWLEKLALAAYTDEKNMTVTPFSNAAGAFSVPKMGVNEDIPQNIELDKMAKLVEQTSNLNYIKVPTGNGFCMYVKREAFKHVGLFDAAAFGRGYGEENDFCMKLKTKGFHNIISDDTYIYHKRSASFGEDKKELIGNNLKILNRRYPTYRLETQVFSSDENLIKNRIEIQQALKSHKWEKVASERILYVVHEGGGGTILTNQDLMTFVDKKSNHECFLLTSNSKQMKLYKVIDSNIDMLECWNLSTQWDAQNFYVEEYEDIYYSVIHNLHIDLVHIRHLFKHSFDIVSVCDILDIPVILSFHDFYFICPTVNLINSKRKYCSGICTPDDSKCTIASPMIKMPQPHNSYVQEIWQEEVRKVLSKCRAFVTTSFYTRDIFVSKYPEIADRFYIIEHGRDFEYDRSFVGEKPNKKRVKILLAGNIDYNKGEEYILSLIKADKEKQLEFYCIGNISEFLKQDVTYLGEYEREDFRKKIQEIRPSYIGVFSIWPETYCHIVTEAWSCGVPCIVSDIGTLRERGKGNGCILANLENPRQTVEEIVRCSSEEQEYSRLLEEVQIARILSISEMGMGYLELYKLTLKNKINSIIYFLDNYETNKPPPSTYIRVLSPIMENEVILSGSLCVQIKDVMEIKNTPLLAKKQYVIVQRDRIDHENFNTVKELVQLGKIELIFEIDDDLLNIHSDHPEIDEYMEKQKYLKELAELSSAMITTSGRILESFKTEDKGIVIPNVIDERIWLKGHRELQKIEDNKIKILYSGSMSHFQDLKILEDIVSRAKKEILAKSNREAEFYIIGGCSEQSRWAEHITIPDENKEYPYFISWLNDIVRDFHIGIAPLDLNNTLNKSKSYLKYLEYSTLKIAGIYTDIEPFRQVIKHRENGLLVEDNKSEAWVRNLVDLCCDDNLRENIIENSNNDLMKNHLLRDNRDNWADVFKN